MFFLFFNFAITARHFARLGDFLQFYRADARTVKKFSIFRVLICFESCQNYYSVYLTRVAVLTRVYPGNSEMIASRSKRVLLA